MDVVFLLYGLSFLALGLVVVIWPKEESRFELAGVLHWLAAFAFVHGALEWTDLWREVRGDNAALATLRPLLLFVSYALLFEFGRRLVRASVPEPGAAGWLLDARMHAVLAGLVLAGALAADDKLLHVAIWSRYLVGTSGSVLAGVGFLVYCPRRLQPALPDGEYRPIWQACRLAGAAFLAYGVFGGLVVPRADWFPANWLNQDSFAAAFHVPVQWLRALCAVLVALSVGHVLRVFYVEGRQLLRASLDDAEIALVEVRRLSRKNDLLLSAVSEGIFGVDRDGKATFINPAALAMVGFAAEEVLGKRAHDLLHHTGSDGKQLSWDDCAVRRTLASGVACHEDQELFWRKDGTSFPAEYRAAPIHDQGRIVGAVVVFQDIGERRNAADQLEMLAHYDALTRLPNRVLLSDRLEQGLAQTKRAGTLMAVCYLDLDGFKPVNDQYGHEAGDELLMVVAHRLKETLRAGDTVARLGGDEFVLILLGLANVEECERAATRVLRALAAPVPVKEHEVRISASIGITIYPLDDYDADTLLRHADQAMYLAKQGGRNRYHLFDPTQDQRARIHREAIERIREALDGGEFRLHYQPKVDMRQGVVLGFEALIRWHHPERGVLLPAEFLTAVAGTELDPALGRWVIGEGLRQMAEWRAAGLGQGLSLNVSAGHLLSPGFVDELRVLLDAYPALERHAIEIEILETAALEDIEAATAIFQRCRELGINIALDDFGTGYSSLSYFRRLPVDTLKIDQMFVRSMLGNAEDLAIVESVIGLTQAFGRDLVAEGVETPELGMLLLQMGCDVGQGYGIARPMPAHDVPAWTASFRPDPTWAAGVARLRREDLPLLLAEMDHRQWVRRMEDWLAEDAVDDPPPTLDPHACRFGRWYFGAAADRYAGYPGYAALGAVHDDVHRVGNELVRLRRAGDPAAARARLGELAALRDSLIDQLQMLEVEIAVDRPLPATHS